MPVTSLYKELGRGGKKKNFFCDFQFNERLKSSLNSENVTFGTLMKNNENNKKI